MKISIQEFHHTHPLWWVSATLLFTPNAGESIRVSHLTNQTPLGGSYLGSCRDTGLALVESVHPADPVAAGLLLKAEVVDGVPLGDRVALKY